MIFKKALIVLCLAALMTCLLPTAVNANKYHEDPSAIKETFSGLSLLLYYSDLLDLVQKRDLKNIESALSKLDFANVPPSLRNSTHELISAGTELSHAVAGLVKDWQEYNLLLEQYRLAEAALMVERISEGVASVREKLNLVELSVRLLGSYLRIDNLYTGSDIQKSDNLQSGLKQVYDEVLQKISLLQDMTASVNRSLEVGQDLEGRLLATHLSLEVSPPAAFCGDAISFSGSLNSDTGPLAGREVEILADNARWLTARCDDNGHYQGTLTVPYRYSPSMTLQAVFHPAENDRGQYLASSSPVVNLSILFYQAGLNISLKGKAYPGKEVEVKLELLYPAQTPLQSRQAEIYLDDYPVAKLAITDSATQKISLSPDIDVGRHSLIAVLEGDGRYAPVRQSITLETSLAVPLLEMVMPSLAPIPVSLVFRGKLSSETGPLKNALVVMKLRDRTVETRTGAEGNFEAKMNLGLGLNLLGTQALDIRVEPAEPWNEGLSLSRPIFMINLPNCAILFVLLAALSYYLPRRLRGRGGENTRPKGAKGAKPARPAGARTTDSRETGESAENPVFAFYRLALKLVASLTRAIMKPQQTLREYAGENSRALGPLSRYFNELTRLMERLLYSNHRQTPQDQEKSRELYQALEKESRRENP